MYKIVIAITLMGIMLNTAGAEEFYLKHDRTGKMFGPYETEDGAKVKLGSATFTVVKKDTEQSAVEKKLKDIEVPRVEFRNAALQDAVEFLQMETRMRDPKKKGVNFVVAKPKSAKKPRDYFGGVAGRSGMRRPTVTLSMKDTSALQVLKFIIDQTGCSYKTSENTVTIIPEK